MICIDLYKYPDLYVFAQLLPFRLRQRSSELRKEAWREFRTALAESVLDERSGYCNRLSELPIVSPFQVSRNRRNINLEPFGGLPEPWLVQEAPDGLPLFHRDLRYQGIVQTVKQIYRLVEGLVVRAKGSQDLEFVLLAAFHAFQRQARELERFAGEVVDRGMDAVRDFADADPYAEG